MNNSNMAISSHHTRLPGGQFCRPERLQGRAKAVAWQERVAFLRVSAAYLGLDLGRDELIRRFMRG